MSQKPNNKQQSFRNWKNLLSPRRQHQANAQPRSAEHNNSSMVVRRRLNTSPELTPSGSPTPITNSPQSNKFQRTKDALPAQGLQELPIEFDFTSEKWQKQKQQAHSHHNDPKRSLTPSPPPQTTSDTNTNSNNSRDINNSSHNVNNNSHIINNNNNNSHSINNNNNNSHNINNNSRNISNVEKRNIYTNNTSSITDMVSSSTNNNNNSSQKVWIPKKEMSAPPVGSRDFFRSASPDDWKRNVASFLEPQKKQDSVSLAVFSQNSFEPVTAKQPPLVRRTHTQDHNNTDTSKNSNETSYNNKNNNNSNNNNANTRNSILNNPNNLTNPNNNLNNPNNNLNEANPKKYHKIPEQNPKKYDKIPDHFAEQLRKPLPPPPALEELQPTRHDLFVKEEEEEEDLLSDEDQQKSQSSVPQTSPLDQGHPRTSSFQDTKGHFRLSSLDFNSPRITNNFSHSNDPSGANQFFNFLGVSTTTGNFQGAARPSHSRNSSISSVSSTGTRNSITSARARSASGTDIKLWKVQRRKQEWIEERVELEHNLVLISQGYNDAGVSGAQLNSRLEEIDKQIQALELEELEILKENQNRRSQTFFAPPELAEHQSLFQKQKLAQELKKKLLPLDHRAELYSNHQFQFKLKRKSKLWFLEDFEFFDEIAPMEASQQKDTNSLQEIEKALLKKDLHIDANEILFSTESPSLQRKSDLVPNVQNLQEFCKIGSGNHSEFFKVVWTDAPKAIRNGVVALKRFKNTQTVEEHQLSEDVKKFRAKLHPNLVHIFGISALEMRAVVLVEYLNSQWKTLFHLLHHMAIQFDILLVLKIAKQVALGMHHLHTQCGIPHRGLTTGHIFVNPQDANGVKISGFQFGISDKNYGKLFSESCDSTNSVAWRPPEMVKGDQKGFSEKTDMFHYGLVVWEILTSKKCFDGMDRVTVQARAAYENFRPTLPQSCPPLLRKMIRASWHSDPEQRPSFNEIIDFFKHVEGKLFFSSRGGFWTLDKASELERENQRRKKYRELLSLLELNGKQEIKYSDLIFGPKIGTGSFAKVFIGTWKNHTVAVKVLKNQNITEKFFLREVKNLQNCYHPNVVVFLGASIEPPAIITEYMSNGSLYDALHEKKVTLEIFLVVKMALDVAEGMKHLHSLSILHRDLTSKNILLDEYQNLKISDFGLSRSRELEMSLAGICAPRWRPPEITKGNPYDEKVDVYSYALVLYEMLTSKLPFEDLDGVNAAAQAAYCGKRPDLPNNTPEPLQHLIKKSWAEDPTLRPTFPEIATSLSQIQMLLLESCEEIEATDNFEEKEDEEGEEGMDPRARSEPTYEEEKSKR